MKIEEIIEVLKSHEYKLTGEDGGMMIQELKEALPTTLYQDLGVVNHPHEYYGILKEGKDPAEEFNGGSHLELLIFEHDIYRFICIEDTETYVSPGGTCDFGDVELFIIRGE
jgi:hypothetical protein